MSSGSLSLGQRFLLTGNSAPATLSEVSQLGGWAPPARWLVDLVMGVGGLASLGLILAWLGVVPAEAEPLASEGILVVMMAVAAVLFFYWAARIHHCQVKVSKGVVVVPGMRRTRVIPVEQVLKVQDTFFESLLVQEEGGKRKVILWGWAAWIGVMSDFAPQMLDELERRIQLEQKRTTPDRSGRTH